jgi:hypothetical protein
MGEARRRQQQRATVTALLASAPQGGDPTEIAPREAARLYAAKRHIIVVTEEENPVQVALLDALACVFGSELRAVRMLVGLDTRLPRSILKACYDNYRPPGERVYPPVILGFVPDSPGNRALVDAVMVVVAHRSGRSILDRVTRFHENGPIVFFGDASEGGMLLFNLFQPLLDAEVDDWSMH